MTASLQMPASVDLNSFVTLRRAGERAIEQAAPAPLAIDFSATQDASSLMVALMTAWFRHANGCGGSVEFVSLPGSLQSILAFTGLNRVLPVSPSNPGEAA